MKKISPLFLISAFCLSFSPLLWRGDGAEACAQSPSWQWAKSVAGSNDDVANSVTTDASGNIYVVGSFKALNITFGSTTLTNAGNTGGNARSDIFIVKYDASGTVIWAKSEGGTSDDDAKSVATDASGNIYVVGHFADKHIIKYDAGGTVLWAKSVVRSYPNSVTADASGNIYVAGYFGGSTIIFDSITLTNANLGYTDMYIVKYDADGSVLWAKSAGGTARDEANSVTTDASGNIYVAGRFVSPTITFGTTILTNYTNNSGNPDMYVVKYDASGAVLWAKSAGGSASDEAHSVTTDVIGNVYVVGDFRSSSITFGSTTLNNISTSAFSYDIYIVKYDASGTVIWAKSEGGVVDEEANSVTTDASGNIYVVGYFSSPTITFGTTTFNNTSTSAPSKADMYIVKYSSIGAVIWAKRAGGEYWEEAKSVATDTSGNIYVAGYFSSPTTTFGSTTLNNYNTSGYADMFVAKLDPFSVTINISCYAGGSNGLATAIPAFGVAPYSYLWSTSPVQTTQTATGLAVGTYTVSVTDSIGGIVRSRITITQPLALSTTLTATNASACTASDGKITAVVSGGTSPKTYLWSNGKTTATITGLAQGTYTLTVTDANGCTKVSIATVSCPNGIEDMSQQNDFIISPNPTSGVFVIASPAFSGANQSYVNVYNVLGKCIFQYTLTSENTWIDLSNHPNGIYFLRLKSDASASLSITATQKLIISK